MDRLTAPAFVVYHIWREETMGGGTGLMGSAAGMGGVGLGRVKEQ